VSGGKLTRLQERDTMVTIPDSPAKDIQAGTNNDAGTLSQLRTFAADVVSVRAQIEKKKAIRADLDEQIEKRAHVRMESPDSPYFESDIKYLENCRDQLSARIDLLRLRRQELEGTERINEIIAKLAPSASE